MTSETYYEDQPLRIGNETQLLLDDYGTAQPPGRIRAAPELAYLPGFG